MGATLPVTSLASKAMPAALRLRGSKKTYSTAQNTQDEVAGLLLRPKSFNPPARLDRTVDLSVRDVGDWRVYDVTPKHTRPVRHALYLHGGAYIHEITPPMWSLVAKTAVATATRFTVPIYRLAPLGVAEDVVPAATDLAAEIINDVGAAHTALLGDSAGGGMTTAVALQLRDHGLPAPYRTVLMCPWMDVSLSAPDIPALAERTPSWPRPVSSRQARCTEATCRRTIHGSARSTGTWQASDQSPCSAELTTSSTQTPSVLFR